MKRGRIHSSAFLLPALIFLFSACEREKRELTQQPPSAGVVYASTQSPLQPGPLPPLGSRSNAGAPVRLNYEYNAYGLSEGKRLFNYYNCAGCHGHGGGGMGPPLLDDKWIYGYAPDTVFETIVAGRPNGMPSFAGKIPDYQVWQLVGYVRSMSGLLPFDAAPARDDHMQLNPPENTKDPEKPHIVPSPPDVLPVASTSPTTSTVPTTTRQSTKPATTTKPAGGR